MLDILPKKGDVVVWKGERGNICYRLTEGKSYRVMQDTVQDVWYYAGDLPFYPTPLVHVLDDNGKPFARHVNYWRSFDAIVGV